MELVKYFGEDVDFKNSENFFSIINDFMYKFEVKKTTKHCTRTVQFLPFKVTLNCRSDRCLFTNLFF
jgi:hypothetical protein